MLMILSELSGFYRENLIFAVVIPRGSVSLFNYEPCEKRTKAGQLPGDESSLIPW